MTIRSVSLVVLAIVVLAAPAFGQPPAEPPKPSADSGAGAHHFGPGGPGGIDDAELREMVSTIMMVRISRSLELSEEQTVLLVKHVQEMRDEISKVYAERDAAMKALRELVAQDNAGDAEINAKLKELVSIEERRVKAKSDAFDKASAGLTAKQKAKLYLTLQDFEGQMRRMMMRAKEMGEDAVREKLKAWERGDGDGPPFGPRDKPGLKQFMPGRRPGPPPDSQAPPPPAAEAAPAPQGQ